MVTFDERYFEKQYANYDRQNPQRKLLWYRNLLMKYLDKDAPVSIGDVGCGGAGFLSNLPSVWNRYGVDPAGGMLQKVRKRDRSLFLCCGKIEHLPFKGGFDAVTLFDVLEHVPDLDAVAQQLDAQLAPGGILVLVVPVYDGPLGPLVRHLDHDPTHVHRMSRNAWLKWTACHFDLQSWYGIGRYYFARRYYIHLPTRVFRSIAPAIAVVATKRIH